MDEEYTLQPEKHVCGQCQKEFSTEGEYLDHECSSGFTPKDPENLGPEFQAVSEAALARGEEQKNAQPENPEG